MIICRAIICRRNLFSANHFCKTLLQKRRRNPAEAPQKPCRSPAEACRSQKVSAEAKPAETPAEYPAEINRRNQIHGK